MKVKAFLKSKLLLVCCCFPIWIYGQKCDCKSTFEWMKQIIEENDAGFSIGLEAKGQQAYQQHNKQYVKVVKKLKDSQECAQVLDEWYRFFRSGHKFIVPTEPSSPSTSANRETLLTDSAIIATYQDQERLEVDLEEFSSYLSNKSEQDLEGVWKFLPEPYLTGIKKVGEEYVGFIIEADGVYWSPGQVKYKIQPDGDSYSATYFMKNHSVRSFSQVERVGQNYLSIGDNFVLMKRMDSQRVAEPMIDHYFRSYLANSPFFEQLDAHTSYLRIPDFSHTEKAAVDSVITAHRETILQTPNLIIDLLDNGGGSDETYEELLGFLYTNPIRTMSLEFLSTELNNQRMQLLASDSSFSKEIRDWANEKYEVLSQNLGRFVNLDSLKVNVIEADTVYPYPQNIGILINGQCASTTEQFLLAAKQSKKVKLFGRTTFGALDMSNMNVVLSPCGNFQLGYCLSRSYRIPHMAIDGKGIQPDYYMDEGIPKYRWIEQVHGVLNQHTQIFRGFGETGVPIQEVENFILFLETKFVDKW